MPSFYKIKSYLMVVCILFIAVSNTLVQAENTAVSLSQEEITNLRQEAVETAKNGDIKTGIIQLEKLYNSSRNNIDVVADYIVLLTWDENWPKAVAIYEENKTKDFPFYVLPEVARAYRYTSHPNLGIALYEKYLVIHPQDNNAKVGIARILIDMRAYVKAQEYIDTLIKEFPENIDFYLLKSDFFIAQNQLTQAQDILTQALVKDLGNRAVQANLAQIYLWRGWPRKALALFAKLYEGTKDDVMVNNGYVNALNETAHKKEARRIIADLCVSQPHVTSYRRTKRAFEVEDKASWRSSASYGHEMQGEDEALFNSRYDYPLADNHKIFMNFVRRIITQTDTKNDILNKLYLGDQWHPDEQWLLIGAVSEYLGNKHLVGGMGQIVYTPNDYWTGSFFYESAVMGVPLRSRKEGTNVDEYQSVITFRPSDVFNSKGGADFQEFSDGNRNRSYFWYTDSRMVAREKWSLYLGSEVYYSTFSKQDVSYFAPRRRCSLYVIPRLEHVWFRKNGRAFVERYYAGGGKVWQKDINSRDIGLVRYEHDYTITDILSMVIGVAYYWNSYDGSASKRLNVDSAVRILF